MRRARFAVSGGDAINDRATVRDALTFDLRVPETSDDDSLAAQRVGMFDLAPALLGATHLVWGLACFLIHPTSLFAPMSCNPLIPLISVLALDGLAFAGLWHRDRFRLSPRTVSAGLCAYLGLSGADLTPEIADVLNLDVDGGALVQSVVPDSPADDAGIEAGDAEVTVGGQPVRAGGDVIVEVDGQSVESMTDVIAAVDAKQPGDEIDLTLLHGANERTVSVELGERPASARP